MALVFWKMFCMADILSLSWMLKTWNCSGKGQRITDNQATPAPNILYDHSTLQVDHPTAASNSSSSHNVYLPQV